ncbi:MAG: hypothetical protein ACRCXT_08790 [Paraclostridium sp.]
MISIKDLLAKLKLVNNKTTDNADAIQRLQTSIENMNMTAENISINDAANIFESTNVEGALSEVMTKSNEAFQSGVSAKNGMKEAINSKVTVPDVSDSDNWNTYIQRVKDIKEGQGNAVIGDVLEGKTFTNDSGQMLTGTMVNRGGAQTITPTTSDRTLSSGYYSGNITVKGDANLKPENIMNGINLFGIVGNLQPKQVASGTISISTSDGSISSSASQFVWKTVNHNLGVTPSKVVIHFASMKPKNGTMFNNPCLDSTYNKDWDSSCGSYWDVLRFYAYIGNITSTKFDIIFTKKSDSYGYGIDGVVEGPLKWIAIG